MKIVFESFTLELTPNAKGYIAAFGDQTALVEVVSISNGELRLQVDGRPVHAWVTIDGANRWVTLNGQTYQLSKSKVERLAIQAGHAHSEMIAPMPGQVRAIQVVVGEAVIKGQTLLVVEAMKMEMRVQAPKDGVVKRLFVKQGANVERDQVLIEIE